jgi:hypothetical protein
MSGASPPLPKPVKNAKRNEKDRKRRADGLKRHQRALTEKQAEIDRHLAGSLTGVLGQMANFKGVAKIIRDYQKSTQPWDDNEPVDWMECRGMLRRAGDPRWDGDCAAHGDLQENEVRAYGPLENEIVRLRAQVALEERNANLEERRGYYESQYAFMERQVGRRDAELKEEKKQNADLNSKNDNDNLRSEVNQLQSEVKQLEVNQLVYKCGDCEQHERNYGWTGQQSGSGFCDLAPSILHYNWF